MRKHQGAELLYSNIIRTLQQTRQNIHRPYFIWTAKGSLVAFANLVRNVISTSRQQNFQIQLLSYSYSIIAVDGAVAVHKSTMDPYTVLKCPTERLDDFTFI